MLFGSIDIPDEILDAQANGTLVIFAGAGISKDAPANLPDFPELSRRIGEGSALPLDPKSKEPLDQYLGRLEKDKFDVHAQARQILTKSNPEPNEYHTLIPKLFPDVTRLRIASTNQDTLLLNGLKEQWGDVNVYEAPALPLGDDFTGLVFLHGSVRQEPRRMVLTDADFSRAYLIEGWARRFLLKLFENNTVLFIGYSHNDTVIRYLARGLPPGKVKRYALISDQEKHEDWRHLGIKPISYDKADDGEETHKNLRIGLQKWAYDTAMGALEHRSRIIMLAENPPPEVGPDRDYLLRQLRKTSSIAVFVKHAKHPAWISWVAERGLLEPLFKQDWIENEQLHNSASNWADWLAEMGVGEGHLKAFDLVFEKNSLWNRILWFAVAQALHVYQDIPDERFNHWVRALLAAPIPSGGTMDYLGYALTKCKSDQRSGAAVLLFDRLTSPTPKQRERILTQEKEEWEHYRWDVSFPEDDYLLREVWRKFFLPNLDRFVDQILPISERNLRLAYETVQLRSDDFDFFNEHRFQIGGASRIHHNGVIDVAIDATRDCLRWLIRNRAEEGIATARRYMRSEQALFYRLALDALEVSGDTVSPDSLLAWVLDADLIHPEKESGELSQLLKSAYAQASEKIRIEILNRIDERYEQEQQEQEWYGRRRIVLLHFLFKAAPKCEETARRWNEAKKGIPEGQLPSGIPGELHEPKVGWVVPISPYTKEQLLEADPASVIAKFAELPTQEDFFNRKPGRSGFKGVVRELASENIAFGLRFAEALSQTKDAKHPLWKSVLQGWREAPIKETDWPMVVEYLEKNDVALYEHHSNSADILKAAIENEQRRIPFSLLPRVESLGTKLWNHIEPLDDRRILSKIDWGSLAISSTAGAIAQFWLHALSWRRKEAGSEWRGLPDEYKTLFARIVDGDSYGAKMGQVILTQQIHFIFYLDQKWAKERLGPLFSFDINEDRAKRVWSGFSTQGQLSPPVVDMLRPQFQSLFGKLLTFSDVERRGLVERIAAVVHHEGGEWWTNGLLAQFIDAVGEDDLAEFTATLGRFWEAYDENKRAEVWDGWISSYIADRAAGKPKPFSSREIGALASWIFPFAFMADRFIIILIKLPVPELRHAYIFHQLEESSLPSNAPEPTTRLISWLLEGAVTSEFYEGGELIKIVKSLIESGIERAVLENSIGDQCVRLNLHNVCDLLSGK